MVREQQQASRPQAEADSASGRRQDKDFHSELLDHPHWKGDGLQVMTFVIVETSLENDDLDPGKFTANDLARVPGDSGYREVGNLAVRYDPARATLVARSFRPDPSTMAARGVSLRDDRSTAAASHAREWISDAAFE